MWLYQLSPNLWSPERYRLEIWEGERWNWPVGGRSGEGQVPKPGDTVVFFSRQVEGRIRDSTGGLSCWSGMNPLPTNFTFVLQHRAIL
jgi:hypothetical protein